MLLLLPHAENHCTQLEESTDASVQMSRGSHSNSLQASQPNFSKKLPGNAVSISWTHIPSSGHFSLVSVWGSHPSLDAPCWPPYALCLVTALLSCFALRHQCLYLCSVSSVHPSFSLISTLQLRLSPENSNKVRWTAYLNSLNFFPPLLVFLLPGLHPQDHRQLLITEA